MGDNTHIQKSVVALVTDLMFGARIEDAVRRQGGAPILTATPEELVAAVDKFPVLALLDLEVQGDWEGAVRRLKARPHTKVVPLVAFGSHVDTETLRRARQAGVDHAWARSKFVQELPQLIRRHLSPPPRYVEGWDDRLSELAQQGVAAFNRREFYPQHDFFEAAWMEEKRPIRQLYQGILQAGVGFYQVEQGNWRGAIKMLRRGIPKLRSLPPICQGLDVATFRDQVEAIHAELTDLGAERLAEFDTGKFPSLQFADSPKMVEQTANDQG